MTHAKSAAAVRPKHEHSVPWFWPAAAGIELAEEGMKLAAENLRFAAVAGEMQSPPPPEWATKNRVGLDLPTMFLRDFSRDSRSAVLPVLIDAPYAGHRATIADYETGQSLVETLLTCGLPRVLVTDWKSATEEMRYFSIDSYLAELLVAVEELGGRVCLVGLCQGGWMAAMFAARFPEKVRCLVVAGSPIDTTAGEGAIRKFARDVPMQFFEEMVAAGGGRMLGRFMLAGWKNMHPDEQYLSKFLDLYEHIEDKSYVRRTERFERWYENPIDLPGTWYLQAIRELFKENRLAKGQFVALGRRIALGDIHVPVYLLAGEADDVTTPEQVFHAARLFGTPASAIVQKLVPGGHIGLFMGSRTLELVWPEIGAWLRRHATDAPNHAHGRE